MRHDRRITHTVADEGQAGSGGFLAEHILDRRYLAVKRKLCFYHIEVQRGRDGFRRGAHIAREHDERLHALCAQLFKRVERAVLYPVRDHYVTGIHVVHRNVYRRTWAAGHGEVYPVLLEKRRIADVYMVPVDKRAYAATRDILDFENFAIRRLDIARFAERTRYRMARAALGGGGDIEQFLLAHAFGKDLRDRETPFRHGSGLVKDDGIGLREGFNVLRRFCVHSAAGCAADARRIRKRDGDRHGARAGQDEHGQRAAHPFDPLPTEKRRQHGNNEREYHHCGRIYSRKARGKALLTGADISGVRGNIAEAPHGRVFELARDLYSYRPREIHAAGHCRAACIYRTRSGSAGQRRNIDGTHILKHLAVQRDDLVWLDDDRVTDLHLIRCKLRYLIAALHACHARKSLFERLGGFAAALLGGVLKHFPCAEAEHHRSGSCEFSDAEAGYRS